jgi:hypothetical protein
MGIRGQRPHVRVPHVSRILRNVGFHAVVPLGISCRGSDPSSPSSELPTCCQQMFRSLWRAESKNQINEEIQNVLATLIPAIKLAYEHPLVLPQLWHL